MEVVITNKDYVNLKKFMILHSKKAKIQKMLSLYGVAFEFIVVGLLIDGLFKTAPACSIASVIMTILWLIFYPKFYKKMCDKHIKAAKDLEEYSILMNFSINDETISFSPDKNPKPSEFFSLNSLNRVVKSSENYFLGFKEGHYMVLPLNDQISTKIENLVQKFNANIEEIEI
ncbi:hypothetical protein F1B92_02915 [Campylobacter sp. FMV-PI01]|uniref:YcxB family protein n=1 Tax=Campylobacter portucalensis TaxID=2608384 RepID=A0A6L5WJG0_9BACT|nr:hypothetical protein [Campylobacter portucalensis]MSN96155.1 hypothetical protein [Campylobacter portucalensis]